MKVKIISSILLIIILKISYSQNPNSLLRIEKELNIIGNLILNGTNDSIKQKNNNLYKEKLIKALETKNSFSYPFDSLITIARISSDDSKFRIFNWHLPKENGRFEYYGIVQVKEKKEKSKLFILTDSSSSLTSPEKRILTNKNWYGAHYYKIISTKHKGIKYYTLLGWHGNTRFSTKKIIDVITFNKNTLKFGSPIFEKNDIYANRIIFEYMAKAGMSLKYESQLYYAFNKRLQRKKEKEEFNEKYKPKKRTKKYLKQKSNKKRYLKHKKSFMIVFDRLSPLNKNVIGIYQFYVPETNIFDAYIFHKGKWYFEQDVDARNPENKSVDKKMKSVKQGLIEKE